MGGCCFREAGNQSFLPKAAQQGNELLNTNKFPSGPKSSAQSLTHQESISSATLFPRPGQTGLISVLDELGIPKKRLKKPIEIKYAIHKDLGKCSSGKFYLGEQAITRIQRIIHKVEMTTGPQDAFSQESLLIAEISTLSKIDHPNVMKIAEILIDKGRFYVVSEAIVGCKMIDFAEFIGLECKKKERKSRKKRELELKAKMESSETKSEMRMANRMREEEEKELKRKLEEAKTEEEKHSDRKAAEQRKEMKGRCMAQILMQMLHAINYCHAKSVIHKNLSISTVLLFETSAGNIQVKIVGFGSIRGRPEENLTSVMSPIVFSSPEALDGTFTEKSDIWSCGAIGYLMFSKTVPFCSDSKKQLRDSFNQALTFPRSVWSEHPPEIVSLLRGMLEPDPNLRLSAAQCLAHPFFQQYVSLEYVSTTDVARALMNLRTFSCTQRLKMIILSFISVSVKSPEEKQPLINVFRNLDTNNDGVITSDELLSAYSETMPPDLAALAVSRVFENVDFDNSGSISFSEFMVAASDHHSLLTKNNLKTAFSLFDTDKSGDLSLAELKMTLKCKESEEQWEILMRQVDENNDGSLNFKEFGKLMKLAVQHASRRKGRVGN